MIMDGIVSSASAFLRSHFNSPTLKVNWANLVSPGMALGRPFSFMAEFYHLLIDKVNGLV